MRGRFAIAVVAIALLSSGCSVWAFGTNASGQLGDGTTTGELAPMQIGTSTWTAVSASPNHTCAIRTDSTLWCSGDNGNGQVGDGTLTTRLVPTHIGSST